jgi:hypothetical protein
MKSIRKAGIIGLIVLAVFNRAALAEDFVVGEIADIFDVVLEGNIGGAAGYTDSYVRCMTEIERTTGHITRRACGADLGLDIEVMFSNSTWRFPLQEISRVPFDSIPQDDEEAFVVFFQEALGNAEQAGLRIERQFALLGQTRQLPVSFTVGPDDIADAGRYWYKIWKVFKGLEKIEDVPRPQQLDDMISIIRSNMHLLDNLNIRTILPARILAKAYKFRRPAILIAMQMDYLDEAVRLGKVGQYNGAAVHLLNAVRRSMRNEVSLIRMAGFRISSSKPIESVVLNSDNWRDVAACIDRLWDGVLEPGNKLLNSYGQIKMVPGFAPNGARIGHIEKGVRFYRVKIKLPEGVVLADDVLAKINQHNMLAAMLRHLDLIRANVKGPLSKAGGLLEGTCGGYDRNLVDGFLWLRERGIRLPEKVLNLKLTGVWRLGKVLDQLENPGLFLDGDFDVVARAVPELIKRARSSLNEGMFIGRAAQGIKIPNIPDPDGVQIFSTVSKIHAKLRLNLDGTYQLMDAKSKYGTYYKFKGVWQMLKDGKAVDNLPPGTEVFLGQPGNARSVRFRLPDNEIFDVSYNYSSSSSDGVLLADASSSDSSEGVLLADGASSVSAFSSASTCSGDWC